MRQPPTDQSVKPRMEPSHNLSSHNLSSPPTDDELYFAEEVESSQIEQSWKILIVDDDAEVHNVTQLALSDYTFEGKALTFISAYSAAEAMQHIQHHPDIAIIFLDVVMESEDAGLQIIKDLRERLDNQLVRIIVRTGQPGRAPEDLVVMNYGIDDYKTKTELTSQKLFTTVTTALRTFSTLTRVLSLVQSHNLSAPQPYSTPLVPSFPDTQLSSDQAEQQKAVETLAQLISNVSTELDTADGTADSLSNVSDITRIAKTILRATDDYFAKLGISQTKLAVLTHLNNEPDLCASPSFLATHCDVSRAAMTGLLDGLEQDGLVERADHPSDRRSLVIRLTDKGKQFVERVMPQDQYQLSDVINGLTALERQRLVDLANTVLRVSQK